MALKQWRRPWAHPLLAAPRCVMTQNLSLPIAQRELLMGCQKGKKKAKDKPGAYCCQRCGATNKKKDKLCKPKKIKKDEG